MTSIIKINLKFFKEKVINIKLIKNNRFLSIFHVNPQLYFNFYLNHLIYFPVLKSLNDGYDICILMIMKVILYFFLFILLIQCETPIDEVEENDSIESYCITGDCMVNL